MTVEKAFKELKKAGAEIYQIDGNKFIVVDNGFWNFAKQEDPFIVEGDDILEMHEMYLS